MPELPEVETVRSILETKVLDKRISSIISLDERMAKNSKYPLSVLEGEKIKAIKRRGKYLLFYLENHILLSHLRMEGKYYLFHKDEENTLHTRIIFNFDDDTKLLYDDSRRFGIMEVYKIEEEKNISSLLKLGKEPFDIEDEELFLLIHQSSLEIKSLLLDQSIIAGIGNIYADEILFASKISPFKKGKDISLDEIQQIIINARLILNKAIKKGGSTIRSYHPSKGIDGLFQEELQVYGKKNKPCPICQKPIRTHFLHGRSVTYCPSCQHVSLVIALYGKIASGKSSVLEHLENKGYKIFSADKEVDLLYKKDKALLAFCLHLFGETILTSFNTINKNVIKQIIIQDEDKKVALENYIHPRIEQKLIHFIKENRNEDKVIVEIPLLFEAKLDHYVDEIIALDIPLDKQIANLRKRKSKNVSSDLRLNANNQSAKNKKHFSILISNDSSLEDLYKRVDDFLTSL